MTLEILYQELLKRIKNNTLIIDSSLAEGTYADILAALEVSELTVADCGAAENGEEVSIWGTAGIWGITGIRETESRQGAIAFSGGKIRIATVQVDAETVSSGFTLAITGKFSVASLFGETAPYTDWEGNESESLFIGFSLIDPVFELPCGGWQFTISGLSCRPENDLRWDACSALLDEKMYIEGTFLRRHFYYPSLKIRFLVQRSIRLPSGSGTGSLVIDTAQEFSGQGLRQYTRAYMEYEIHADAPGKTIIFKMPLLTGADTRQFSAYMSPPLTVSDIEGMLKNVLQIPESRLLMPEGAFLSSFGLEQLDLVYAVDSESSFDSLNSTDMKHVRGIFSLGKPLELFVPNLTMYRFRAAWESSRWWGEDAAVTLFLAASAGVTLGNLILEGDVTAYYPSMEFTGKLSLRKQSTLQELAQECKVVLPGFWTSGQNEIASVEVMANAWSRALYLYFSVSNILELKINDSVSFALENIGVELTYSEGQIGFGLSGTLGFQYSENGSFAFTLSAQYQNEDWLFSGALAHGSVNLGQFIKAVLGIGTEDAGAAGVELQDFCISYSVKNKELLLYASCEVWFDILGIRTSLGGRVRLRQTGEIKEAALTAYVDIEKLQLRILAQVNDIYAVNKQYIFRIELFEKYLEAIYEEKISGEVFQKTLSISLGGISLGDIVLAVIHLLNPNARNTLPSPWNILNKVELSRFVLTIDLTNHILYFLYEANLSLAGIMEIRKVGISYNGSKVRYILTGKCPGMEYTEDNPFSWDAMTESPQENIVPNEKKFRLYYLGFGNHLEMELEGNTLEAMLEDMRSKLSAERVKQELSYGENGGWMIASDFELSGMFRLRFLLYDPKVYGLAVELDMSGESEDSPLKFLSGLALELFYKKISEETGMFHCRMTLPKQFTELDLGAAKLYLGEMLLEIYTNGSFYIDLGFPHNRDFSKSWGVTVGIYSGKGGIYFGVFKGDAANSVPQIVNGAFSPVVKMGIGLSVGFAQSFDFGIVSGGVSLTVIGIFEGVFAVFQPQEPEADKALYYKVSATVGIVGTLVLSVDFKIITVKASAEISAYCELQLESFRRAMVAVDLKLTLQAYIKILFLKISFSFDFSRRAEFYLGSDSDTPWKLAQSQERRQTAVPCEIVKLNPATLEEKISISPLIMPLCSLTDCADGSEKYCMAFPAFLRQEDFDSVLALLTQLLCGGQENVLTEGYILALTEEKLVDAIDYDFVREFFENNIQVNIGLSDGGENPEDGAENGVIFPMLPQLCLAVNEETHDFGGQLVDEAYIKNLESYFEKTNADMEAASEQLSEEPSEELPICAVLLTDWFKMLVKELAGRIAEFPCKLSQKEQIEQGAVLRTESAAGLRAERKLTVAKGDTLEKLAQTVGAEVLWECASGMYGLPTDNIYLQLDGYIFKNNKVLTGDETAALFYVRLFSVDVIYTSYAELVLAANDHIDMQWECMAYGETEITLPDGRKRAAFAGENVESIAKMCAVLEPSFANPEWLAFLELFRKYNPQETEDGENPQTCLLFGTYTPAGCSGSLAMLFRRCFPDFCGNPQDYSLWLQEILRPSMEIDLENSGLQEEVISCRAEEQRLTYSLIEEQVLSAASTSEIAAVVSRAFLQGMRIPSIIGEEEDNLRPMYEVLGQQITLPEELPDYCIQLSLNTEADWIHIIDKEITLSADQIKTWLPKAELEEKWSIQRIAAFSEREQCFTMAEGWMTNNGTALRYLGMLPQGACDYLEKYQEPLVLEKDCTAITDLRWAAVLTVRLRRVCKGIYYVIGVKVEELERTFGLLSAEAVSLELYSNNTGSGSRSESLIPLDAEGAALIKTNLSKETHHVSGHRAQEGQEYAAFVEEGRDFLKLLWECTVIGGGYWLYLPQDDIADFVLDEESCGEILAAVSLEESDSRMANAVYMPVEPMSSVLYGAREFVSCPALPTGCVGFEVERSFDNEDLYQSLFQLLGYRVGEDCEGEDRFGEDYAGGKLVEEILGTEGYESLPVLPTVREGDNGSVRYRFVYPIWKMFGDNLYAGVGNSVCFHLFVRDILGNSRPAAEEILGENGLIAEGGYNDCLIALHELPGTRWTFCFEKGADAQRILKIIARTTADTEISGDRKEAETRRVLSALAQLACPDIEITASFSLEELTLPADSMQQIRDYVSELYQYLKGETQELPELALFAVLAGETAVQSDLIPIELYLTVSRSREYVEDEAALSAQTQVIPDCESDFAEAFEAVFDTYKLAYNGKDQPVAVSKRIFCNFDKTAFSVAPYETGAGGGKLYSPEYYAVAPLTNALVTKIVNLYDAQGSVSGTYTFVDADANTWERQFLSDMEQFLTGTNVCRVLKLPEYTETQRELRLSESVETRREWINRMLRAKSGLADMLAERVCPVRKGAGMQLPSEVLALAKERFLQDLNLAYDTDVIAAYQAVWEKDSGTQQEYRLEPEIRGDFCLSATKLKNSGSDGTAFCLFLKETTDPLTEMELSFPYLEYNIRTGVEGYEQSEWLRLYRPITENMDLRHDLEIPFPKKECPLPPQLMEQSNGTEGEELLRYHWSAQVSAQVCSQDVLYLQLEYGELPRVQALEEDGIDVLARYQLERNQLMEMLEKEEQLYDAFTRMTVFAEEYLSAGRASARRLPTAVNTEQSIEVRLGFSCSETEIAVTILNEQEVNEKMKSLGASLYVTTSKDQNKNRKMIQNSKEAMQGSMKEIQIGLEVKSLPVYKCFWLKPKAYMVRNADIFHNPDVEVADSFVFHTETMELSPLYISADYRELFILDKPDLAAAIDAVWEMLDVENGLVHLSMTFFYEYPVNTGRNPIMARIPVTFLPDIKSKEEIVANISAWENPEREGGRLVMDTYVYAQDSDAAVVHAGVVWRCTGEADKRISRIHK